MAGSLALKVAPNSKLSLRVSMHALYHPEGRLGH